MARDYQQGKPNDLSLENAMQQAIGSGSVYARILEQSCRFLIHANHFFSDTSIPTKTLELQIEI
ncbi:MAG: hypothetical protein HC896_05290 [Bacteroidales bacterium]|nr:hypothetical protein [Bacteroidales bacterium]